jgi:hypothetical protein
LQLVDCRFTVAHHHQKRFIIEQYNRRERDSKAASAHQIKVHTQPNFLHTREKKWVVMDNPAKALGK